MLTRLPLRSAFLGLLVLGGLLLVDVILSDSVPGAAPSTSRLMAETTTVKPSTARLVFLGDSLTAGFQLPRERSYPTLIQQRIREAGLGWEVQNAGVSGDTSAGALRRADALLRDPIGLLVVWIGANDGLRGQDIEAMKKNIDSILTAARTRNVPTLLVQMRIPPNYGEDYTTRFAAVYPELARKHQVPLVPFLMESIAGEGDFNLPDGVHPNAKGHALIADGMWKAIEPLLRDSAAR